MRLSGVLCCGNIVLDILVRPVNQLVFNTSLWVESIEQQLGGNGASTACALGKLGVPVRLLGVAGRDPFGELALARLSRAGVELGTVGFSESPTATTVVVVNSGGDRMLLHRPGASESAFQQPIEFNAPIRKGLSHFHLANPFAFPRFRPHAAETLHRARAAGLSTSLDTGWDSLGRWIEDLGPCLPFTDLLFVNTDEAHRLTGIAEPAEAARRLRELGAGAVVVKLGAGGCRVLAPEASFASPAFEVPAIDTTGAGDCFAGGFLAALHRGASLEEAARFANAVAALSIQLVGATPGLRSYDETQAWMGSRSR